MIWEICFMYVLWIVTEVTRGSGFLHWVSHPIIVILELFIYLIVQRHCVSMFRPFHLTISFLYFLFFHKLILTTNALSRDKMLIQGCFSNPVAWPIVWEIMLVAVELSFNSGVCYIIGWIILHSGLILEVLALINQIVLYYIHSSFSNVIND